MQFVYLSSRQTPKIMRQKDRIYALAVRLNEALDELDAAEVPADVRADAEKVLHGIGQWWSD